MATRSVSITECVCKADNFGNASSDDPACTECPALYTSAEASFSRNECELGITAISMVVAITAGLGIFLAMGLWVVRLKRKAAAAETRAFNDAINAVGQLHFPMVLIPALVFINDAGWASHEDVRIRALRKKEATKMVYLDTMEDVAAFLATFFVVFLQ